MTQHHLPIINSHDSWSPLEEVWLGDVYPASWYDHLDPAVRDVFQALTEITQQDLTVVANVLKSFGVTIHRPSFTNIEDFLDQHKQLVRPQICPRDHFVVIGNTLYGHEYQCTAWQSTIDTHLIDKKSSFRISPHVCINGANVVRVGRDIVLDLEQERNVHNIPDRNWQNDWPDYRVQKVYNGGHMDACFAILRPGLILANHYFNDYDRTFPGWQVIRLDDPKFDAAPSTGLKQPYPMYNGKFWDTTVGTNYSFNQHIIDHALDWVGCYTETYFELNCLVIDPHNVIMLAENSVLADELVRHDITVHWVPFRTRSFWDGAMHCLTLDIRRDSQPTDYFPQRDTQRQ